MPARLYAERRLLHANDAHADGSYSARKNPAAGGRTGYTTAGIARRTRAALL